MANAPPSVRVQVATITNQLDRLLAHAHPSLAFKNIEAAASGYDQQQQNPANPPAGQKQAGAVEQKEESAKFDLRSIGARRARDGHWYVPDQSRLGKYLTPTPRMRRWRWPELLAAARTRDRQSRDWNGGGCPSRFALLSASNTAFVISSTKSGMPSVRSAMSRLTLAGSGLLPATRIVVARQSCASCFFTLPMTACPPSFTWSGAAIRDLAWDAAIDPSKCPVKGGLKTPTSPPTRYFERAAIGPSQHIGHRSCWIEEGEKKSPAGPGFLYRRRSVQGLGGVRDQHSKPTRVASIQFYLGI